MLINTCICGYNENIEANRDAIKPDVTMFLHYKTIKEDGKEIVAVEIQRGTDRPYYLAKKGMRPEGVYVRQGYSSVPATDTAIRRMIKETDGDRFEAMRCLNQELTFEAAKKEFDLREVEFGPQQMRTLKLIDHDNLYSNLGLLLSDQCVHTIKVAVFQGTDQTVFKDRREFTGSLMQQMNEVYDFIDFRPRRKSLSKNKKNYSFEIGRLHILFYDCIINPKRWFQKNKSFHFLKASENMKRIVRTEYLSRIVELNQTPDIKIITGIRRSGKSELMRSYIEYLKSHFENINIIFVDFMDLAYEELKEYHALHAYVEEHYQAERMNYLFVDEVQMCPQFELAINSLYSKEKYDIYVIGSNAFLLSADLATLFTGRYIEIHVFPFSFREYCQYYSETGDKEKLFDEYSMKGGLAGSYIYRTERDRINYIKEVYETIVTRDLVQKYSLPDTLVLQRLSEFLMDNISNLTSPNKVSQLLTANKTTTNHVTVGRYIKYLCNAFVFYDTKRYDIRGKKYLESSEKFYLCDTGIRYAVLGSRNMDYGRVYENIVCIELLRRGYDVYVGKLYQKEIDFVAQKGSEKIYIQVSDNISEQKTLERECSPLLQIRDAYPKKIIARTRHSKYSYEGIEIYDIVNWLLQE